MKFQYKILCIIIGSLIVYFLAMYNTEEKEYILNAPYNTPVRRLNETKANRELNINYYETKE